MVLHSEGGYDPVQCGEAAIHCVQALLGDKLTKWRRTPERPKNLDRRLHYFQQNLARFGWKFEKSEEEKREDLIREVV